MIAVWKVWETEKIPCVYVNSLLHCLLSLSLLDANSFPVPEQNFMSTALICFT